MTVKEFIKLFSNPGELSQQEFDDLYNKYSDLTHSAQNKLLDRIAKHIDLKEIFKFNTTFLFTLKHNVPIAYFNRIDKILRGTKAEIGDTYIKITRVELQQVPDSQIWGFLEGALEYLDVEIALSIFEDENQILEQTISKVICSTILDSRKIPLYTLDELAIHTQSFLSILENQTEFLIAYGHPQQIYANALYFSNLLPCYYTRFPQCIYHNDPHFMGDKEIKFDIRNNSCYEYPDVITSMLIWSINAKLTYVWPNNNCKQAPLVKGITLEDESFILGIRAKIQLLKLDILNLIIEAIHQQNAIRLWNDSFKLIQKYLTRDEVQNLFIIDRLYGDYDGIDSNGKYDPGGMSPGGISRILNFVRYFELEISTKNYHRLKSCVDRISPDTKITSYFQVIGQSWKDEFDNAIDHFFDSVSNGNQAFWEMFTRRAIDDFENSYNYTLQVPPQYLNDMVHILNFKMAGEPFGLEMKSKRLQGKPTLCLPQTKTYQAKFATVEARSFNWDDIELLFKDSHNIRIKIKGESQQFDYGEMGFKDGNTGKPHKSWSLLESAANKEGLIGIDVHAGKVNPGPSKYKIEELENGFEKASLKLPGKDTKQKQILSDKLKAFFELDTDPFYSYKKNVGWKAKFKKVMFDCQG